MKKLTLLVPFVGFLPFGLRSLLFPAGGLFIGVLAMLFALAVTALALAGAALAVVGAFALAGLILIAVALPFLLPLIVLLGVIVLVTRRSTRRKSPNQ